MARMAIDCCSTRCRGSYSIEAVELDDLRPKRFYVRVEAAGVCHTDANMQVIWCHAAVSATKEPEWSRRCGRAVSTLSLETE